MLTLLTWQGNLNEGCKMAGVPVDSLGRQILIRFHYFEVISIYLPGGRQSSRPWDKGAAAASKNSFLALWASVWSKNKGCLPLDLPLTSINLRLEKGSLLAIASPHSNLYGVSPDLCISQWLEFQQPKEFNFYSTISSKKDVTTTIIFPDKENSTKREISSNYINKHPLSKV